MRFLFLWMVVLTSAAYAAERFEAVRFLPLSAVERAALESEKLHDNPLRFTPYDIQRPREPHRRQVFLDRHEYLADDHVAQALITFIGEDLNAKFVVELVSGEKVIAQHAIAPLDSPKVTFLLALEGLPAGQYQLRARLDGAAGAKLIRPWDFRIAPERHADVPFPADGVPLIVHEQQHLPATRWPMTTGVPLPRRVADAPNRFVLLEDGQPVAAQFSSRATWYPDGRQIKWLGLDFQPAYQNGKPREYRIKLNPAAAPAMPSPLRVQQSPERFTIDTGKIRFTVNRQRFTGVEQAWLTRGDATVGDPLIDGSGGAFLFDERGFLFEAAQDESVRIELEESGPVRATIHATGWYTSKQKNEKLCIFHTRISAYADQPFINVSHRTIVTYDTDKQKLGGLGFVVKHAPANKWNFGADGKPLAGEFAAADPKAPEATVWLHQDRHDHFRLVGPDEKPVAEGKRSDGWASVAMNNASLSVVVRELWQLFPKELELGPQTLAVHFWPKHGHDTFTDEEELSRKNIHKFFYAHEGGVLDLKFPQKYFDAMRKIGPMLENQDINALTGNGQGMAISNDFCLRFDEGESSDLAAFAALYQQNPHAIAEAKWNGGSGVEGRFASANAHPFSKVEFPLDDGYRQNTTTPEILEEYGMWIWPDTHNNWSPVSMLPQWHRLWNLSHYQNVWESWLLYLRSGKPWTIEWARRNTRHYMDVGTVNYDDPRFPLLGHIAGAMYHVKGFTPWGSPRDLQQAGDDYVEVGAHFINPAAFVMAWHLMGDRTGKELMETWGCALGRVAMPPERSRENNTTLGELVTYYTATWDPEALLHITDLADEHLSRPWVEIPAHNSHAVFNAQWVRRYWEHARDPRLKQYVLEYLDLNSEAYMQVGALAYEWTGDKKYLEPYLPGLATMWQLHYDNPADPLHGYGPRLGSLGSGGFAQKAPYFLPALLDAGIDALPADDAGALVANKTVALKSGEAIPYLRDKPYPYGQYVMFLMPLGAAPVATLTAEAYVTDANPHLPRVTGTAFLRVVDAAGKMLLETTLLGGSKREKITVDLDATKYKPPFRLYKSGYDPALSWSGSAEQLIVGPTAAEVQQAK